jgi:two-component system chemotaxis sensor kinase CheA
MTIDLEMAEIINVFFQESDEGLDAMEAGLLSLEDGSDSETINTIFRAAHSIKGGAGTFGFGEISKFTHAVETLLDQMRNGTRGISSDAVQVLLQAVDAMREMVALARDGTPGRPATADAVGKRLTAILEEPANPASSGAQAGAQATFPAETPVPVAAPDSADPALGMAPKPPAESPADSATPGPAVPNLVVAATPEPPTAAGETHWRIHFKPHVSLFETCNDPLRIFTQLESLGRLKAQAFTQAVPTLSEIDPTQCHMSWALDLHGAVTREELAEVFDWVDSNSSITYELLDDSAPTTDATPCAVESPAAPPVDAQVDAPIGAQVDAPIDAPVDAQVDAQVDAPVDAQVDAQVVGLSMAPATRTASQLSESPSVPMPLTASRIQPDDVRPVAAGLTLAKANVDASSIRVGTEKVDALINLVGELVITQSMLGRFAEGVDAGKDLELLRRGLAHLARNTRELQESVLKIRMLPISFSFNRFPRLVRELSRKLEKKVELRLRGESTELDKIVLEKIGDPLVHLVRNSLDHGLETPAARIAAGKSETGVLELNAYHQGGSIIIEVKDDGAGLDRAKILAKAHERGLISDDTSLSEEQIHNLIFLPGFSTAESVSDVSGRGVGMDVVRRNITDLGGHVQIYSERGKGSTIRIRLPLTLAILEGQMLRVGRETYVISLVSIIETVQPQEQHLHTVTGRAELFKHRDEYLPILRLHEIFDIEPDSRDIASGLLVVAESDGQRVAILVDELQAQQQVVIKSLDRNFKHVPGLAGATIHGDGTVALILDVPSLISKFCARPIASVGRAA